MQTLKTWWILQNLSAQLQKAELKIKEKAIHKLAFSVVRTQIKTLCFKAKMAPCNKHLEVDNTQIVTHKVDTTFHHSSSNKWNCKNSWRKYKWKDKAESIKLLEELIIR